MHRVKWWKHLAAALLVLAASLGTTYWLWHHEKQNAVMDQRAQADFNLRSFLSRIDQRMLAQEQMLRGVQGLFAASAEPVSRQAFRDYVGALKLGADFSGLEGIGWVPLVAPAGRADHISAARRQGLPDYDIVPADSPPDWAPLAQLEPALARHRQSLGLDLGADAPRRAAMLRARDSGMATITEKVTRLVETGETVKAGFVMFLPVYRRGLPADSLEARRTHLAGWVVAPFDMASWMASLYGEHAAGIDVRIFDGVQITQEAELYDSAAPLAWHGERQDEMLEYLNVAGRSWTLAVRSLGASDVYARRDQSQIIARSGVILSLLLGLLTWVMVSDRSRAMVLALRMTSELRETKEHFELVFDTSPDAVVISRQIDGRIIDVNPGFVAMTGYGRGDVIGHGLGSLAMWKTADGRDRYLQALRERNGCENLEASFVRKDGSELVGILSAQAASFKGVACFVGVMRDITTRKVIEDRMAHMAQHDALTGLPNRALFDDRLHQAVTQAHRNRTRLALLYIDLDHFKPVNDTFGHATGDVLLKDAARRMAEHVRASDTVARIGGDEFVVLLSAVQDKDDARSVAEKMRQALSEVFDLSGGHSAHISSSIGVAVYPDHAMDELQLSKHADDAMYQAKQMGRDRVVVFGEYHPRRHALPVDLAPD
jgi:diguanylate cyclase (GGDEF)-like protein/PAS domain S-box-containing protein